MYLRISVEDEKTAESSSIASQRDILTRFLDGHAELSRCRRMEFCDDGHSGTNLNRPAITSLLRKIRSGEVCCVVVKDISRLGRSYIEVGNCLERVFPFLGVRFISVNDSYDSGAKAAEDIGIALKTLVYDLYSKDISVKSKSGLDAKKRRGEFAASSPVYGYMKSRDSRNKLEIDEDAAKIVRNIFKLASEGKRAKEIADMLNEAGVPARSSYKARKFGGKDRKRGNSGSRWSAGDIREVVGYECYIGAAVANKTERKVIGQPCIDVPKERWTVVPDAHPPIVGRQEFDSAQRLLRRPSRKKASIKPRASRNKNAGYPYKTVQDIASDKIRKSAAKLENSAAKRSVAMQEHYENFNDGKITRDEYMNLKNEFRRKTEAAKKEAEKDSWNNNAIR